MQVEDEHQRHRREEVKQSEAQAEVELCDALLELAETQEKEDVIVVDEPNYDIDGDIENEMVVKQKSVPPPLSAYILFVKDFRKTLKEQQAAQAQADEAGIKRPGIMTEAGLAWNKLS